MKITILSIPVLDQEKALKFYTEKLGFKINKDEPMGGDHRWITLVSAEDPDGVELLLEPAPLHFEPSKVYQEALWNAGIPWTQLDVEDCDAEFARLTKLGVEFKSEPKEMGTVKYAILNDTCGNYIQIVEMLKDQ